MKWSYEILRRAANSLSIELLLNMQKIFGMWNQHTMFCQHPPIHENKRSEFGKSLFFRASISLILLLLLLLCLHARIIGILY